MIRVILWDVDNTLLNFLAAERVALTTCFERFGYGVCSDAQVARYSAINKSYWLRLERGEITKAELLPGRFVEFFQAEGLAVPDCNAFNEQYQIQLGETVVFIDNGYDLVKKLHGKVKQYAITNGTLTAQSRKLKKSGLDQLFDGIYISEQVGAEKPSPAFFDAVLQELGTYAKDEILVVGDSLTSDMQGGVWAGLRCCWYNPKGAQIPEHLPIEYSIQNLNEVWDIVCRNEVQQ